MAPEVVSGQDYSLGADVWSFGALLLTLKTGEPPFKGLDKEAIFQALSRQRAIELPAGLSSTFRNLL
jgi:serine/threonine protein kinase